MIPIRALWRIDVAARKQEASTAVALVRLLGWGVAMGLWWWLGALTDEQVLLVIAGVESVAALLRAVLPDRFGDAVSAGPPLAAAPADDRVVGVRDGAVDLPARRRNQVPDPADDPRRSGWGDR